MDNCIFCKIVRGEIPSRKVYEDENILSFMDVAGDVDGHILVIPKKHVVNVLDCDEETLLLVAAGVKKVANHLVDECGYDGVNILNANNKPAGQSVFHLHFHIVPRRIGDGFSGFPVYPGAKEDIDAVHKRVTMMR